MRLHRLERCDRRFTQGIMDDIVEDLVQTDISVKCTRKRITSICYRKTQFLLLGEQLLHLYKLSMPQVTV